MPATTTKGYPYPLGSDPVADGDDAIKGLAQAVDAKAGVAAAGSVSIVIASANVAVGVAVTFPAGRFTATPYLITNRIAVNASASIAISGYNPTTTGCTISGVAAAPGTLTAHWYAVQL